MAVPSYVAKRVKKWNVATAFAMNACNAPFSAYIESLRPAAGKAVLTLMSFGLDDVARGFFRPKGVYKQKHLGRRKRGRNNVYLPELGEEIGKRIPGADEVKGRQFGSIEKRLWILDGITQRLFFYLMVADVLTDFVYDWSTGIYKLGFCNTTGTSQYRNTGIEFAPGGPLGNQWVLQNFGTTEVDNNTFGAFPHERSCQPRPGTNAMAVWTFTTGVLASLETDVQLSQENPIVIDSQHVSIGPFSSKQVTLQVTANGGRVLTLPTNLGGFGPRTARCDVFNIM